VRHLMLLTALTLAAAGSTTPAALASTPVHASGIVLSVSPGKLRIVEGPKVEDASYRSALPAGVIAGAKITFFVTTRHRASHFEVIGHVARVLVSGTVVRDGKGLALRLSDSSLLVLPRSRHLKVGSFAHVLVPFTPIAPVGGTPTTPGTTPTTPGTTPTTPAGKCAKSDCTFDITGTVSAIDDTSGAVTVSPLSGGADLKALPGQISTADVFVGDFVHVSGVEVASTGVYTMTELDELPGCDTPDCTVDFDATVDEIDAASITVADDDGDEYPINATAPQLASVDVGDDVHIVAVQDPTTGDYSVKTITVLDHGQ
jgi:hypothetical protein